MLARLALSAVCRLTPLSPEEVADLKLAITEAANDFVGEIAGARRREHGSTSRFDLRRRPAASMDLRRDGRHGGRHASRSSSRAIIEATVDEADFGDEPHVGS